MPAKTASSPRTATVLISSDGAGWLGERREVLGPLGQAKAGPEHGTL